jgi:hypothetical protein
MCHLVCLSVQIIEGALCADARQHTPANSSCLPAIAAFCAAGPASVWRLCRQQLTVTLYAAELLTLRRIEL